MTEAEEDEQQQRRLERRLEKASGCALDGCIFGCLPVLALILLPLPMLLWFR